MLCVHNETQRRPIALLYADYPKGRRVRGWFSFEIFRNNTTKMIKILRYYVTACTEEDTDTAIDSKIVSYSITVHFAALNIY